MEGSESSVTSESHTIADEDANLDRFKRQQTSSSNSNQSATNGLDGSSNNNQDENPPEEILTSFKCSFGNADGPELCKIQIIENPFSKELPGWMHGSGKLALYQGGPLIDASGGNDTSGGYLFYETSSLHATINPLTQNQHQTSTPSQNFNTRNHNQNLQHRPNYQAQDQIYYQRSNARTQLPPTTTNHWKITSPHNQPNGPSNNNNGLEYRQVTSSQYSVNQYQPTAPDPMGPAFNNQQHSMMARHSQQQEDSTLIREPTFLTPNLTATGVAGMCLSFQYVINGLSADELRIHVKDQRNGKVRLIWSASESASSNWTKAEVLYSATNKHAIKFGATHQHQQQSLAASKSSSNDLQFHNAKFRGYVAIDEIDIEKHESSGGSESSACRGHCNFDGDLCGWTNAESGQEDDFDWTFGRGSDNLFTGPARDFVSSNNNELTGSYLHINPAYPRRPGDRAILLSPLFQATPTNEVMCMRLAVHMFGSGIGSLAIKIRYTDEQPVGGGLAGGQASGSSTSSATAAAAGTAGSGASSAGGPNSSGNAGRSPSSPSSSFSSSSATGGDGKSSDLVIWEMSGDSGNNWHQAQTSVSSSKSPFHVVIEGKIGENHLSDIAIDEISFSQGACPTSPPIASKNYGDCTFEQSLCYWRNPDSNIHLDDLDWIRTAEEQTIHGPNHDHTTKKRSGSYLKLENTLREPKSGMRAFLLSPIFQPRSSVQCLSFYYYMFMRSISSSGPNLGTIRVYLASNNELTPIWRLTNPISSPNWKHGRASLSSMMVDGQPVPPNKLFQIAFEGIWGDAQGGAIALDDITVFEGACDLMPAEAKSVPGECTFDVDLCSWINKTTTTTTMTMDPSGGNMPLMLDPSDASSSPFIQYVNGVGPSGAQSSSSSQNQAGVAGATHHNKQMSTTFHATKQVGWQLATVNSRPVNMQDHTYKAPIGYIYVDVLDSGSRLTPFTLQSAEISVPQGAQPIAQCLSFWFAAFGREQTNQLQVFLTQASTPPTPVDADSTGGSATRLVSQPTGPRSPSGTSSAGGGVPSGQPSDSNQPADTGDSNQNAWREFDGKLLWSVALKNMTESSRRRWEYAQVTLKADSNYIVRFIASSGDGGFTLDDISYYEGSCDTRPAIARVHSDSEEAESTSNPGSGTASNAKANSHGV